MKDEKIILIVIALLAIANWCNHFAQEKREERIIAMVEQILNDK